jgi:hypothetical protein
LIAIDAASSIASGPVTVSASFEAGSLRSWQVQDETRLLAVPHHGFDQDSLNTQTNWFFFRLANTGNREVVIQLTGLEYGVYNGQTVNSLPYSSHTSPVYSYDRERWNRFSNTSFDQASRTFTMTQIFSRDTVWVAYIIPYGFARLGRFLSQIAGHEAVKISSFGYSVEGRPLYVVDVEEPGPGAGDRPLVWIIARQHAFETGGTWAAQGLLEFLASDTPEAIAIRRKVNFRVCPMINPDGVVNGRSRFNAPGVDLNRHWNSSDPFSSDKDSAPEIVMLKRELKRWSESHRLDVWINIHNKDMVGTAGGNYIRYAPENHYLHQKLATLMRSENVLTGKVLTARGSQSTEAVVAEEYDCLGMLLELGTGYIEEKDCWTDQHEFLADGRGLARAVARLFSQ